MSMKKVNKKELRKFALTLGIFLAVLGILLLYFQKSTHYYFWGSGGGLILIGLTWPVLLTPLYRFWMALAAVLNFIMLRLILGMVFYLFFTLIGGLGRLFGKQFLDKKKDPNRTSYWHGREPLEFNKERYEKQF